MGYFDMNWDIAITFTIKVSYNFATFTHVLIFINYKFSLNFNKKLNRIYNKAQKKLCLLPFVNLSKLISFILKKINITLFFI